MANFRQASAKPTQSKKPTQASQKPAQEARKPVAKQPVEAVDLLEPKKSSRKSTEALRPLAPLVPIAPTAPKPSSQPPSANKEAEAQSPQKPVEVLNLIDPPAKTKKAARSAEAISQNPPELEGSKKEAPPQSPVEVPTSPTQPKTIQIKGSITVKELAQLMNLQPFKVIKDLMDLQIFANLNQTLEIEIISKLCERHGFVLEREKKDPSKGHHKTEVKVEPPPEPSHTNQVVLQPRPPIVTMMGHVDHGKTSLLDAIRNTRVAAGEAGGITQHIGAYSVERDGHPITFLDTPGHAAFTAMRARGANVTDIVVLVVAADDGLMPQTLEAINHAKAANVAIIVAINKIDLPSANPDRVKAQLQEQGLVPEEWGGQTICCPVSATKGTGIDHLLEMIILQAEILELKANPAVPARATVIEAQVEQGRGPTATVIVRTGTLRTGDPFICGDYNGKVKQLINDLGKPIKQAGPGMPAKVLGLTGLPKAGDELIVMESERAARALSEERLAALRANKLAVPQRTTLENLFQNLAEGQKPTLRLVLKADVSGSVEALVNALKELPTKKVSLDIIHSAVGPISESDVLLASASDAVIIGFGVKVENTAASSAKREGVQIKLFSIIYELIDQVKEAMAGLLEPELRETILGHAEVRQVFDISKGKVAGCYVVDGRISRSARARVLRKKQPIYDGGIATLRRFKDEVKEVRAGLECGIRLGDFNEYHPEDVIQCYVLEKVPQEL